MVIQGLPNTAHPIYTAAKSLLHKYHNTTLNSYQKSKAHALLNYHILLTGAPYSPQLHPEGPEPAPYLLRPTANNTKGWPLMAVTVRNWAYRASRCSWATVTTSYIIWCTWVPYYRTMYPYVHYLEFLNMLNIDSSSFGVYRMGQV